MKISLQIAHGAPLIDGILIDQATAWGVKSKASCCCSLAAPCMEKRALLWGHHHCQGERGPLPPLKPEIPSWATEEKRKDSGFPPGGKGCGFRHSYNSTHHPYEGLSKPRVKPSGQVGMGWCLVTQHLSLTPLRRACCEGVSMRDPASGVCEAPGSGRCCAWSSPRQPGHHLRGWAAADG